MSEGDGLDDFDAEAPRQGDFLDPVERRKLDLNDRDNGVRLHMALVERMIYAPGLGFGVWDGARFDFEAGEEEALKLGGATLQRLIEEEAAAEDSRPVPKSQVRTVMADKSVDEAEAERRIRAGRKRAKSQYAVKCGDNARVKAALEAARARFRVSIMDLDAQPYMLTCANGVLDLGALRDPAPEAEEPEERRARLMAALRPFDPALRATRAPAVAYDPDAACPQWRAFLERAFPESVARAYLRRVCGYLLGGRTSVQCFVVLIGQGGNGKSTLARAVQAVLRGHASTCRIQMFLEDKNVGQGPTPEEAVLPGARVMVAGEPEEGSVLSSAKLKALTGGDVRQSRAAYGRPFEWRPRGVPVLSFNKFPRVTDASAGFWRRVLPVRFTVALHQLPPEDRVGEEEMDRRIEAEASGILNWMLEGWVEFHERGFDPPEDVLALASDLREMADPVGQFLLACTENVLGASIGASELHEVYERWCRKNGQEPLKIRAFKSQMVAKDFRSEKASVMKWRDLAWKQEPEVSALIRSIMEEGGSQ